MSGSPFSDGTRAMKPAERSNGIGARKLLGVAGASVLLLTSGLTAGIALYKALLYVLPAQEYSRHERSGVACMSLIFGVVVTFLSLVPLGAIWNQVLARKTGAQ